MHQVEQRPTDHMTFDPSQYHALGNWRDRIRHYPVTPEELELCLNAIDPGREAYQLYESNDWLVLSDQLEERGDQFHARIARNAARHESPAFGLQLAYVCEQFPKQFRELFYEDWYFRYGGWSKNDKCYCVSRENLVLEKVVNDLMLGRCESCGTVYFADQRRSSNEIVQQESLRRPPRQPLSPSSQRRIERNQRIIDENNARRGG